MPARISALLQKVPFKTMLVVVALSYVEVEKPADAGVRLSWGYAEFFPLSSFPMFSTFSSTGNLVYVTDGERNPILPSTFNSSTGGLTKSYRKYLHERRKDFNIPFAEMTPAQKMQAGTNLLRDLRDSIAPEAFADGKLPLVLLVEVHVRRGADGEIEEEEFVVGELATPEGGAP